MIQHFKPAIILLLLFTLITGGIYPVVVTGLAQLFFNNQANGSLITNDKGQVTGSSLIGQSFSAPQYFWGRPSATSPAPYNAAASSGSNLGLTNPALVDAVKARMQVLALNATEADRKAQIPVDLITASASGLDPHISPAAAHYQINRVAKARHIQAKKLHALVEENTQARQWFLLGEPRVNVLNLNLALDKLTANSKP